MVNVTHSVNGGLGSGMVVDGAGFVLNNRRSYFGLDEADINVIAPGKRTRQGAIPALALKDGKPFLEYAGRRHNTADDDAGVLNVVEFGMNVRQAPEAQPPYGSPSGPGAVKMILIHPVTGVLYGGASPGKDNYVAGS